MKVQGIQVTTSGTSWYVAGMPEPAGELDPDTGGLPDDAAERIAAVVRLEAGVIAGLALGHGGLVGPDVIQRLHWLGVVLLHAAGIEDPGVQGPYGRLDPRRIRNLAGGYRRPERAAVTAEWVLQEVSWAVMGRLMAQWLADLQGAARVPHAWVAVVRLGEARRLWPVYMVSALSVVQRAAGMPGE